MKVLLPVVFPTPVGVFPADAVSTVLLDGLPHARGGVSRYQMLVLNALKSSPRPWGCFLLGKTCHGCLVVFPTPVGVFL